MWVSWFSLLFNLYPLSQQILKIKPVLVWALFPFYYFVMFVLVIVRLRIHMKCTLPFQFWSHLKIEILYQKSVIEDNEMIPRKEIASSKRKNRKNSCGTQH